MINKKSDLNKKLYNYEQALRILKEDDYISMFIIINNKFFNVTSENKSDVISLLTNAILKLKTKI